MNSEILLERVTRPEESGRGFGLKAAEVLGWKKLVNGTVYSTGEEYVGFLATGCLPL
jgi:hypothetical protein